MCMCLRSKQIRVVIIFPREFAENKSYNFPLPLFHSCFKFKGTHSTTECMSDLSDILFKFRLPVNYRELSQWSVKFRNMKKITLNFVKVSYVSMY